MGVETIIPLTGYACGCITAVSKVHVSGHVLLPSLNACDTAPLRWHTQFAVLYRHL